VEDLNAILELALGRGVDLLTAGELHIVRRIRGLRGAPARLYARLTARRPIVFAVDRLAVPGVPDPAAAVEVLVSLELMDRFVPWDRRLAVFTVVELKEVCRALELPVGGRRAELEDRLQGRRGWSNRAVVQVRHRGLIVRLEQWALLRRRPDRSAFVVERLGHVRWPSYACTPGTGLHRDRRHLLGWEALWRGRDELEPEVLLRALDAREEWPPGNLDLRGPLRKRILCAARDRERAGDPAGARALYQGLVDGGHLPAAEVAVRVARTLEAEGRSEQAWEHLVNARASSRGPSRLAIARSGRRLAAQLRRGWAPDPPPRRPPVRHLVLPGAERIGTRPGYQSGEVVRAVEPAVAELVSSLGRTVLFAEGPLWTTLFALLFADAYFLPVPGALPVPFLAGPLDVGRPDFARRRPIAVAGVLDAVGAGEAPERIRVADERLRGTWLSGAAWNRASVDQLVAVAKGMGPTSLRVILETLLREGWRAARGLPDLVVLPGPRIRLPGAMPSRLGEGLVLAEVKGPTDSVRDEQAAWFDRLLGAGAKVELWQVSAGRGSPMPTADHSG